MSSVLPDPPPAYINGGAMPVRLPHSPRAPLDRGIHRTTECPCAVRLYAVASKDIVSRNEYCSLVLGAPSVGISEAVRTGVLASETGGPSPASTPAVRTRAESSIAVERPIAVQLAWADTTVWEVARTALQAVRSTVDAAFEAERKGRQPPRSGVNGAAAAGATSLSASAQTQAEENRDDDEEAAPYSTPPHRYEVELLTGSVSSQGQASVIPLCTVACRQVFPDHPGLLPMRRHDFVDYNTALYELLYNLGDPVFVTCTRTL